MKNPILFFDGVCNLCNGWVDFVLRRNSKTKIYFAPLQGVTAQHVVGAERARAMQSLVFFKDGSLYEKSDAFFEVIRTIGGIWKLLLIFKIIPRFIRDKVYGLIATHRYTLFGKRESCRLPVPEERELFLD